MGIFREDDEARSWVYTVVVLIGYALGIAFVYKTRNYVLPILYVAGGAAVALVLTRYHAQVWYFKNNWVPLLLTLLDSTARSAAFAGMLSMLYSIFSSIFQ